MKIAQRKVGHRSLQLGQAPAAPGARRGALLRSGLVLGFLLLGLAPLPAGQESRAFNGAAESFRAGFYDQAETEFADFIQKFPASGRVPEAVLFQAEARIENTNFAGAVELLKAHQAAAGTNADQYLYWTAEAYYRQRDFRAASVAFAQLRQQFPASARCLEAVVGEATSLAKLSEWPQAIALLAPTNSIFQRTARPGSTNELAARGWLLLSEAHLVQQDYAAAERALAPVAGFRGDPKLAWQREYLRCRILEATGQMEAALQNTTNLLAFAAAGTQHRLEAGSTAYKAGLLEKLGRLDAAIAAYAENLKEGIPVERQRQALLKMAELYLKQDSPKQDKLSEAVRELERFLAGHTKAPAADVALLTLGELRLRQHLRGNETNLLANVADPAPGGTNSLGQAVAALQSFTNQFSQSPLLGKAQLDLGWCYWLSGKMPESQAAFQTAFQHLPETADRALALFKAADAQFRQTNFAGATASYAELVERFGELPQVKTNLCEPALYQSVQAGLAGGNLAAATNAMTRLLVWFPNGFHTGQAVLLTGQQVGQQQPAMARRIFSDFLSLAPQAPLAREVELAIARTYEQENDWAKAARQYAHCLGACSNLVIQPRVEFYGALANYHAGHETDAQLQFSNLVVRFPKSEYAPLAQWWVADYAFSRGDLVEAEKDYQAIYQNTNFPPSELAYQARMNAGRVAVAREGWEDAKDYFAWLAGNTNCPAELRAQAFAAYGDYWIRRDSTNKLDDYQQAFSSFDKICKMFEDSPANRQAVLAWGKKAECLLLSAQSAHDYELATNAFQQVLDIPGAELAARSPAMVGLASALEKMAENKDTPEARKSSLLNQALHHYLEVLFEGSFYREGEVPDPFWRKKAGLEAVRLAEKLQLWEQEIKVCKRMQELLPPLKSKLQEKIQKASEKLR